MTSLPLIKNNNRPSQRMSPRSKNNCNMSFSDNYCCRSRSSITNARTIKLITLLLCFVGSIQFYREAIVDNNDGGGGRDNELRVIGEPKSLVVGDATLLVDSQQDEEEENEQELIMMDNKKKNEESLLQQALEGSGVIARDEVDDGSEETYYVSSTTRVEDVIVDDDSADMVIKNDENEKAPNKNDNEEQQSNTSTEENINQFTKEEANKLNNEEEEATLITTSSSSVEKIILLGERHSGTNWITDHLTECFDIEVSNYYKRRKHWFQEEDLDLVPENSAVVVAMFRDPYDWVEAMRVEPHHSHDHVSWPNNKINYTVGWRQQGALPLPWKEFVTKPWIGKRGRTDQNITKTLTVDYPSMHDAKCQQNYSWVDIAPCSEEDSLPIVIGLGQYIYEYQHDGSERGFSSIINLRRDKVINHLSVANFKGVRSFHPFRFEDLNVNGTAVLLQSVEEATGLKRKCNATLGKALPSSGRRKLRGLLNNKVITKHDKLPDDYVKWMTKYVDWEVEERIGYSKRGGDDEGENDVVSSTKDVVEARSTELTTTDKSTSNIDKPVEKIILLGERHSGTNWITDHLEECFDTQVSNTYMRFKHWFQEEDLEHVPENSAVVVAMFRDPYDWVEAMRVEPHHSSHHLSWPNNSITPNSSVYWKKLAEPLDWKTFVTKPWVGGERGPVDRNISKSQEEMENAICMDRYQFEDIIPCSKEDMEIQLGLGGTKYESIHDGSGRGYPSIIDLRRDKILNHLSVADFLGTRAFLPFRFEDLNTNGTSALLNSIEEATGLKAKCNTTIGKAHRHLLSNKAITHHKPLSDDYIKWMTKYVDWEVENRIGYFKRALKDEL